MLTGTRREWLQAAGGGFGALALRALLDLDGLLAADATTPAPLNPLAAKPPHFAAKAKAVIFLFMYGGPSHIDLFDPKPELAKQNGKPIPVYRDEDAFQAGTKNVAMSSPYKFAKCGKAGIDVAEVYPELGKLADELCVIRSVHCESNNHGPALFQMNSGFVQPGRPAVGSWATYGLGSETENLPGFVVMLDHQGAPVNGALNWSNGFMPAAYQGVPLRSTGEPIAYLSPPPGVSQDRQRARLDLLKKWNEEHAAANPAETALAARIASYDLAFKMQTSAAEAVDMTKETAATRREYGLDDKVSAHFGRNCLLARRLVEKGVRFVQVNRGGFDVHYNAFPAMQAHGEVMDPALASLVSDLASSGLLSKTLIIMLSEFGRTPKINKDAGRDHHAGVFTCFMAGGGIKGGTVVGTSDEDGYKPKDRPVAVPDLHATVCHALGIDGAKEVITPLQRPLKLVDGGKPVMELFA